MSLFVLIRGADYLIEGAKQIGFNLGIKPLIIGVFIVGFGTSLPELASSIAAIMQGASEIVIANVVGSNITNILLIIGLTAFLSRGIFIKENLLKSELPIFFIATLHFVMIVRDGLVDRTEAWLLLGTFAAYTWYIFSDGRAEVDKEKLKKDKSKFAFKPVLLFVGGLLAVLAGANYTVEMTINLATAFAVPLGLVSILAIALGTSLPELMVSLRAIKTGDTSLAIGNIFGSNAFNMLMVAGIPAAITPLVVDDVVMDVGLMILIGASAILFVSGLARQILRWEGLMMLIFFAFFLVKLVEYV
ncbi:MAG: calcium/sodium antiporter [Candidatus Nomurabacteria bacterium]|nr:MAG: calcium/sodium antiporter [Candidatus Nomurabacteria bacterium]